MEGWREGWREGGMEGGSFAKTDSARLILKLLWKITSEV